MSEFCKLRLCGLIVRVRVVPRRTVVGDIGRHVDNLSGSHHQSHVNCKSFLNEISRDAIFLKSPLCCHVQANMAACGEMLQGSFLKHINYIQQNSVCIE